MAKTQDMSDKFRRTTPLTQVFWVKFAKVWAENGLNVKWSGPKVVRANCGAGQKWRGAKSGAGQKVARAKSGVVIVRPHTEAISGFLGLRRRPKMQLVPFSRPQTHTSHRQRGQLSRLHFPVAGNVSQDHFLEKKSIAKIEVGGPPSPGPPSLRRTAQNFALFFPSPATIFILSKPQGLQTTAREPKTGTFERPDASNTPPKFHERTPKRR